MRIRIEEEAAQEAQAASDWYDTERPGLGREFLGAIDTALEEIVQLPRASARVGGGKREIRQKLIAPFSYLVVYELVADEIAVLAIAHTSRRPGTGGGEADRRRGQSIDE